MITDLIRRIDDALAVHEVWRLHCAAMSAYGFDRLLYVHTRFRSERSFGDLQDALVLCSHPRDYARAVIESGIVRHAPMIDAASAPGAMSWRDRDARGLSGLAAATVRADRGLGLVAGYDIVFPEASARSGGAIALTAAEGTDQDGADAIWDAHGGDIELLNRVVHRRIAGLPTWGGRRPLTPQQRRVLQWAAQGKTAQDTALIMEVTPATVEKHLRLAREALDTHTTAQAVMKATGWNQLFA